MSNTEAAVQALFKLYRIDAQLPNRRWAAAAEIILRTLEQNTPAQAASDLEELRKRYRTLSISCLFDGAAKILNRAIRADAMIANQNEPSTVETLKEGT